MARSPWWGGFFERMVGIMKRSLSKSIGTSLLAHDELRAALLDVEIFMNNRPLTYVGEDCDQPVLTPNALMGQTSTKFLEEDLEELNYQEEDKVLTRRMRYLHRTREHLRKRWQNEYLHALQERNNRDSDPHQKIPQPGSVVLLTDALNERKPEWKLGKVMAVIRGKDNVIRGLKLKCGSGYTVERPLQLVYDLEIASPDAHNENEAASSRRKRVNADDEQLHDESNTTEHEHKRVRLPRQAKDGAVSRMKGLSLNDQEES